jgi:hypothetical protein
MVAVIFSIAWCWLVSAGTSVSRLGPFVAALAWSTCLGPFPPICMLFCIINQYSDLCYGFVDEIEQWCKILISNLIETVCLLDKTVGAILISNLIETLM